MQTSLLRKRPLLASLLGFLYPGLGHLYLRAWIRAVAWFGLAMLTAAMVVPQSAITAFQQHGVDGLLTASRTFPMEVTASLLVVRLLNVVDAYLTGLRQDRAATRRQESEAGRCPNCGGELDADLDFCPWCTTRLAEVDTTSDDDSDRGGPVISR